VNSSTDQSSFIHTFYLLFYYEQYMIAIKIYKSVEYVCLYFDHQMDRNYVDCRLTLISQQEATEKKIIVVIKNI